MTKTSGLRVYARKPRARHDVGVEPLDWWRIGLVLTVVLIASGGGLAVAGLLRQGPLRDIGWTDRKLERFDLVSPKTRDTTLGVAAFVPGTSCPLEVTVDVIETPQEVVIGPVHSREPRLPFAAPECKETGQRSSERVYAVARLSRQLGTREVVDATHHREVRVVAPPDKRTTPATVPSATPATTPSATPGATPAATP